MGKLSSLSLGPIQHYELIAGVMVSFPVAP
jgi:hypothetical protein